MKMIKNDALFEIGITLKEHGYHFTAITPESHHRVLARKSDAIDLRGVFGWNQPFSKKILPGRMFELMQEAKILEAVGDQYICKIRFATLYDSIYIHSGFPTVLQDAVFFGPDTYRYARLLRQHVKDAHHVVDIGCGSGAGALSLRDRIDKICLTDINPLALEYARINAKLNEVSDRVKTIYSDVLTQVEDKYDLVISNPPYMIDDSKRTYRHGGELFGAELSVRIVREGLEHLTAGGKLILYTASAIVNGIDTFWQAIQALIQSENLDVFYEEIDPDVFGEELERTAYQQVERLSVVGLVIQKN